MSEKKYYWLKLQNDFFGSKRIKKLRKLGADFVIIYLKMQLLSLKNGGVLEYTGIEDSFADELALDIDEDTDKVQLTISFLQASGLLEARENNEFFLPYVEKNTGSEMSSAERQRRHREKKNLEEKCDLVTLMSHDGNAPVTNCHIEIEIEIDKDKEIEIDTESSSSSERSVKLKYDGDLVFGIYSNVFLTLDELNDLKGIYGVTNTMNYIDKLSAYIKATGKQYTNHHDTLVLWLSEDRKVDI